MSGLPVELIVGIVVAVFVVVGGLVAFIKGRRRSDWDALDDSGPSELLPAEKAKASSTTAVSPKPKTPAEQNEGGVFKRLVAGLARTRGQVVERLDTLFSGGKKVDDALWQELEELLITSDVGVRATHGLLDRMKARAAKEELEDAARLRTILREEVLDVLNRRVTRLPMSGPDGTPLVVMVVGVNGAGKTTTIGKLAARATGQGKKVLIGAGDTFRAAAIEQVVVWGKRAGAEVVRHEAGSDPAAVSHDAVTAGLARGADLVIVDTAGRLHTKSDLMAELGKVHRVIKKVQPAAPHEVLLVLDSTNGQNAIAQAKQFAEAVGVTAIALTKLDGTARGGVIIAIAEELEIPVALIGIGEGMDDLRDFDPEAFVAALFDGDASALGRGSNSAAEAANDERRGIAAEEAVGSSSAQG